MLLSRLLLGFLGIDYSAAIEMGLELLEHFLVALEEAGKHGLKATMLDDGVSTVIALDDLLKREVLDEGLEISLAKVGLHEVHDQRPQILCLNFHYCVLFYIN